MQREAVAAHAVCRDVLVDLGQEGSCACVVRQADRSRPRFEADLAHFDGPSESLGRHGADLLPREHASRAEFERSVVQAVTGQCDRRNFRDIAIVDSREPALHRVRFGIHACLDDAFPCAAKILEEVGRMQEDAGHARGEERVLDGYLAGVVLEIRVRRLYDRGKDELANTGALRRVDHVQSHLSFIDGKHRAYMEHTVHPRGGLDQGLGLSQIREHDLRRSVAFRDGGCGFVAHHGAHVRPSLDQLGNHHASEATRATDTKYLHHHFISSTEAVTSC